MTEAVTEAEPLTGKAGVEAEFGYKPLHDEPPPEETSDLETVLELRRQARADVEAERALRNKEFEPEPIEYRRLDTGEKTDPNLTVSLEEAASDLGVYRAQQIDNAAKSISSDFAREVDKLRADALEANPEIAKDLGLSKEEISAAKAAKADEAVQDEPAAMQAKQESSEPDPYLDAIEGLEPETREALKKPQVRQFLETYAAEGEQVKQAYPMARPADHRHAVRWRVDQPEDR